MLKKFFLKIFEKISSSFFFYFFLAFILFHVLIQLFIFLPNIFYSFLFFFERVINILDYLYLYFKFDYIDTFVENICWGNFYYTLVIENFLWDITEIYTPHALYIKAKCEMFYFGYFFYFFFTPYILAIILSNIIFFVFLETSTFSIFFFYICYFLEQSRVIFLYSMRKYTIVSLIIFLIIMTIGLVQILCMSFLETHFIRL